VGFLGRSCVLRWPGRAPTGGVPACPVDLPLGLLLPAPTVPDRVRSCLRRQSQQMMPPEPDLAVASGARLPVPAISEAALTAIPLLDRLPPLGDRQAPEFFTLIQRVGRRILALADRTRPVLPRSRVGCSFARPPPPLRRPHPGPGSGTPIPFLRGHLGPPCTCLTACQSRQWQGRRFGGIRLCWLHRHQRGKVSLDELQVDLCVSQVFL
jgi:hypothetical protein